MTVAALEGQVAGVCSCDAGLGHPLWFDRSMVETLAGLHGDKSVWKLVDADNPRVVDTWDDHRALLEDDR